MSGADSMDRRNFLLLTAGTGLSLGIVACGGGGGGGTTTGAPTSTVKAKAGGVLRVGVSGGSTKDLLEPQFATSHAQQARMRQLYESLMTYDREYQLQPWLAEEVTQESPKQWVVRLREGLTFHNGKPVEAADVVFSLQRILEPNQVRSGAAGLAFVDSKGIKAVDKRTVRIPLTSAAADLPQLLGEYYNTIVPRDFDIKNPVGTGPFKYTSFTPGQESRFERFGEYWQQGQPLLDAVVISDISDDSARVNALLGGQVDCIDSVPSGQVRVVESQAKLLESESGGYLPITMRCDDGPFRDPRVRLALKLIADREQMVAAALGGHGRIANDIYSPFDPMYDKSVPQRTQDIEQAKTLLQQAGASDLRFTLTVSPVASGTVETAQVLAEQAKAAGVTIQVQKVDPPTFYGANYGKWTSTVDVWGTRNYLPQVAQGSLPTSPFNTPHWENPKFLSLYKQAMAQADEGKRADIAHEMQKIERDDGGNVIPYFYNYVDGYAPKVVGLLPDKGSLNLGGYNFRQVGLT